MNTLHLQYAVEVEKTGSITQAAENLYMAQPNLSKAIKELEDSLGIPIFKRSSKGVVPTEKGAAFLASARRVLAEVKEMEALGNEGRDSLSFRALLPKSAYPAECAARFAAGLPETVGEVRFWEENPAESIRMVLDGQASFAILRIPFDRQSYFSNLLEEKGLTSQPYFECTPGAVLSPRHPALASGTVDWNLLHRSTELLLDAPLPSARRKAAGEGRRLFLDDRAAAYRLLSLLPEAYLFDAPLPSALLDAFGLIQVPGDESAGRFRDSLVSPSHYRLTPLEAAFFQHLKQDVARLG